MPPQELALELERVISGADNALYTAISSTEERMYRRMISVLKSIETDSEGYIKQTGANRKILAEAENIYYDAVRSPTYVRGLSAFTASFNQIDALNFEYFKGIKADFSVGKNYMKSLQKQAIETLEKTMLNQGLESQIKVPLMNVLNQNINSGGSFSGMVDQVKNFITGTPQTDGRLLRYAKQATFDTLSNYSRAFQQGVTSDLGLTWYCYAGGAMDKTRDFCLERMGNFYNQKEIESWADLDWSGKAAGTTKSSIFIYAGGYQCRHSIIPVSERMVPKDVLLAFHSNN